MQPQRRAFPSYWLFALLAMPWWKWHQMSLNASAAARQAAQQQKYVLVRQCVPCCCIFPFSHSRRIDCFHGRSAVPG